MRKRDARLIFLVVAGGLVSLAMALILFALRDSVVYFYAPSELALKAKAAERVRIGGLVAAGSVSRDASGRLLFIVTDGANEIPVSYDGQPPDLFREGQGIVAEGRYEPGARFVADTLLAKHDETYMPREVAEALKKRGEWKGGAQ